MDRASEIALATRDVEVCRDALIDARLAHAKNPTQESQYKVDYWMTRIKAARQELRRIAIIIIAR